MTISKRLLCNIINVFSCFKNLFRLLYQLACHDKKCKYTYKNKTTKISDYDTHFKILYFSFFIWHVIRLLFMQDRKIYWLKTSIPDVSLHTQNQNDLSILSGNTSDQRTLQLKEAGEHFGKTWIFPVNRHRFCTGEK